MKIEVKLDNPKYCRGCPMLDEEYRNCRYYPWEDIRPVDYYKYGHVFRSEICVAENGE